MGPRICGTASIDDWMFTRYALVGILATCVHMAQVVATALILWTGFALNRHWTFA